MKHRQSINRLWGTNKRVGFRFCFLLGFAVLALAACAPSEGPFD